MRGWVVRGCDVAACRLVKYPVVTCLGHTHERERAMVRVRRY